MTNDGTAPDEADTGSTTSDAVGRRTLLRAAGGVAVGAAVVGRVSAQEAVVVRLSEETAMPGEQVSVSLTIEGEQEPETTVAGVPARPMGSKSDGSDGVGDRGDDGSNGSDRGDSDTDRTDADDR